MESHIPINVPLTEDYVLEADGTIKLEHANFTQALKAGFELKQKFSHMKFKVYDAKERTPVHEQLENETKTALS